MVLENRRKDGDADEKGTRPVVKNAPAGTALFLTTVTVWVLSLTADMGAAAQTFQTLAESPAFVSAALRAELGNLPLEDEPLNGLKAGNG